MTREFLNLNLAVAGLSHVAVFNVVGNDGCHMLRLAYIVSDLANTANFLASFQIVGGTGTSKLGGIIHGRFSSSFDCSLSSFLLLA